MKAFFCHLLVLLLFILIDCIESRNSRDWSADQHAVKWYQNAQQNINKVLNRKLNHNVAKNLILFLGDGMGISTVTAGRIRKGQKLKNSNGEEEVTFMENLPHLALSKTYNINAQTADSAGTATAYLTGVKTRIYAIGVDGRAKDCPTSLNSRLESILKWAHAAGKSTGIVTTTRVTHASPAAAYSSVFDRNMESFDGIKFNKKHFDQGCRDIADQLLEHSSKINLIFAGGRMKFMPKEEEDFKEKGKFGDRIDGRNLIDEWKKKMRLENNAFRYVWNMSDFERLKSDDNYTHILGLLAYDHLEYEEYKVLRKPIEEPSLKEMTKKAIEILSKNPNGYFLFVEGGRIDHGHHSSNARMALDEFVQFDETIGQALHMTSDQDTQVVVTADHSHVFSMGGYSFRGNPILGISVNPSTNLSQDALKKTYTSLLYGNGPGGLRELRRTNLTNEITESLEYKQESAVYLKSETHGGEDVAIYASGPMSYLFDGTVEQSYVAHAMAFAACIGPYNLTNDPKCVLKHQMFYSVNYETSYLKSAFEANCAIAILNKLDRLYFFVFIFQLILSFCL